jgi:hypothetical protein
MKRSVLVATHGTAHVVEGAPRHKKGSPASVIWGDSRCPELYIYDVYVALGMMTTHAGSARAAKCWFHDGCDDVRAPFRQTTG